MARPAILLTALVLLVPSFSVRGADVLLGPEVPITLPTIENLPGDGSRGSTIPLWTGQEWLFAWSDARTRDGVYLHRLDAEGRSIEHSNVFVRRGHAQGLGRSGSGYLIATDGIDRLDHSLAFVDRVLTEESRLLAADHSVLTWHPELSSATLVTGSATTPVDVARVTGGLSPWQEPAVATDGTSYLVVWIHRSDAGSSIRYNIVGSDGSVVLGSPGVVLPSAHRSATVVAGWDGERFLVGWATQTEEGPWGMSVATLDPDSGIAGSPQTVTKRAGWNWGHPQLIQVEPGAALLAWTELLLGSGTDWSTWGRFLESGHPVGEPFLISDEPVRIGFDGQGRFAAITGSATARLYARSGPGLEPVSGSVSLRYGVPARIGLAMNDFDPFAMWMSGGSSWRLEAGWHTAPTQPLIAAGVFEEMGEDPGHAVNGDARLIAWGAGTPSEIRYIIADRDGTPRSEPVMISAGRSPRVTAHADGWLLTWDDAGVLEFALITADGRLHAPPATLAEPVPYPPPATIRQSGVEFISIDDESTLVLWEEGGFATLCRLGACPPPTAPPSVRSVVVSNGRPDSSTVRTYDELGPAGLPAAVRAGDRVLLIVVRQGQIGDFSIEGMYVSPEGVPLANPFELVGEMSGPTLDVPELALFGSTVLAMWVRESEGPEPGSMLEGALIEGGNGGDPDVTPIELVEPFAASSVDLVQDSPSRAAIYYVRQAEMEAWEATRQIFARAILFNPTARRRAVGPR